MITSPPERADVVGIGFGPAQLALGYALADAGLAHRAVFLEARDRFMWHPGMLLPDTTMQVNFMKDLVTPRCPTHPASFINYLHEHGRLTAFLNLKTLFPRRAEFTDYLAWAAERVPCAVRYGSPVEQVRWDPELEHFVVSSGTQRWHARHLVTGLGLRPKLPDGVAPSRRVWHSEDLLPHINDVGAERLSHVVVVGSGQSAAEIVRYLLQKHPHITVTAVVQSYGYAPSDDSPFVNRVFDPEAVDDFYFASQRTREQILAQHRNTNYSVVDSDLIDELAQLEYEQRFQPNPRFTVRNLTTVDSVLARGDAVDIGLIDLRTANREHETADAVVMATGYRPTPLASLFSDPDSVFANIRGEVPETDRHYRARLHDHITGSVWVHGNEESSHGLSSSLLSNIAVRGGEIADSLSAVLRAAPQRPRELSRPAQSLGAR